MKTKREKALRKALKQEQALKKALKPPKEGWGRTEDEEKLLAALCDALANLCCLNAADIFAWAKKHSNYKDLLKASRRLTVYPEQMELLVAVLNDLPLEVTK
jgi:hypothetical protein